MQAKLTAMRELVPMDRNGRMNMDVWLEAAASQIDPMLADMILLPADVAQDQFVKFVTEDLSKIYSGIEVGARPNGAQVAIDIIQTYIQQPDVAFRLENDESFKARLDKYYSQYVFQMQQMENAEIGRLGTAPAAIEQPAASSPESQ